MAGFGVANGFESDDDWDDDVPARVVPPAGRFGNNGVGGFGRVGDPDVENINVFGRGGFGARGLFARGNFGGAFGARRNPGEGFGAEENAGGGENPVAAFGARGNVAGGFRARGNGQEGLQPEKKSKSEDQIAAQKAALKKKSGSIKKTKTLIDEISKLHVDQDMSDVVLIAEGERFPAHKFVLSIRSNYFKAMFCTGLRESTEKEVTLMDTPVKPFSLLLQYVYTGQMQLQTADYQQTLEVLALAHKYEFPVLQEQIVEHLQANLNVENIVRIYSAAEMFSSQHLLDSCLVFLNTHKNDVVTSKGFLSFSMNLLNVIVEKVDWSGSEDVIVDNLKRWIKANIEQV
uniref:BTB domain-containing protein n=1 Tax=Ditylenchus dipsaci TaxID=166011 RepID=A0A915E6W8_9BILA